MFRNFVISEDGTTTGIIVNIKPDDNQIIPEYKIELLNKNNKIIKKIENIERISLKNNYNKDKFMNKKSLFNKLRNILHNKTYDRLVKIDQKLSHQNLITLNTK